MAAKKSAVELLAEMEAKHKEAVKEIKDKATEEIREQLKEARAVVKGLEDELEELTGMKGKVGSGGATGERKQRINSTTLLAVGELILEQLDKKSATSVGTLIEKIGSDADVTKAAIARLKREGKVKSNNKRGNLGAWLLA